MYVAVVVRVWGTSCLSPGRLSPGRHLVVVTWSSKIASRQTPQLPDHPSRQIDTWDRRNGLTRPYKRSTRQESLRWQSTRTWTSPPPGGETGGTNRRTCPPDSATAVNAAAMGSCRSGTSGRLAGDRDTGKNIYPCLSGGRETSNRKVPLDSPARRRVPDSRLLGELPLRHV